MGTRRSGGRRRRTAATEEVPVRTRSCTLALHRRDTRRARASTRRNDCREWLAHRTAHYGRCRASLRSLEVAVSPGLPLPRSLAGGHQPAQRSEEHTSELQSRVDLVCRLLLEKKK